MKNELSLRPDADLVRTAIKFIRSARQKGLDVRLTKDRRRVELYSKTTGRKLCSSPVEGFNAQQRP